MSKITFINHRLQVLGSALQNLATILFLSLQISKVSSDRWLLKLLWGPRLCPSWLGFFSTILNFICVELSVQQPSVLFGILFAVRDCFPMVVALLLQAGSQSLPVCSSTYFKSLVTCSGLNVINVFILSITKSWDWKRAYSPVLKLSHTRLSTAKLLFQNLLITISVCGD